MTKTRATATTGAKRGPKKGSAATKIRKPIKGKKKAAPIAMVISVLKVESSEDSDDRKRIKLEDVSIRPISTLHSYGVESRQRGMSRSYIMLSLTQVKLFIERTTTAGYRYY